MVSQTLASSLGEEVAGDLGWLPDSPQGGDHVYGPGRCPIHSFGATTCFAPDLNPAEGVWHHLKNVELRNVSCQDLYHLRHELNLAIMRLRSKPRLIKSFFAGAGLPLKN